MTSGLKARLIVGFILVFLAGIACGFFIAAAHVHHAFQQMHGAGLNNRMRVRLQHELQLTPNQMSKVGPVIDRVAARLEKIRSETHQQVAETLGEAQREISLYLTPEQQAKLEAMHERHRRHMHGHSPGFVGDGPP